MTLQLYVLRQLCTSIAFALVGIALFVLPTTLIQAIHKLPGVRLTVLAQYLPMVLVEVVPYLLPMAFLLGVVATYGRLAADRELIAIRMAGIHPARLSLPALLVAVVLSLWTGHLLANVSPVWKYQRRNFARHQAQEAFKNFSGTTELSFGESTLTAEGSSNNVFSGVLVDLAQDDGEVWTIMADLARLEVEETVDPETGLPDELLHIRLRNAYALGEKAQLKNVSPYFTFSLGELFETADKDPDAAKYMSTSTMKRRLASGAFGAEGPDALRYEIQRRWALSAIYLVFLLLGIPTGIALRSGTQLGAFSGAVGYGFVYYVLALELGKALVKSGVVGPLTAAWSTNAMFFLIGVALFRRTLWR